MSINVIKFDWALCKKVDEVLAKHEKITYKSGTKSHEFRYIDSGYIKNEPIFTGTYIIKNAENPRFLPNDIDYYLVRLVDIIRML